MNVPGLTADELETLNTCADELDKKSRRNRLRSSYYDGKRAAKLVGNVM